MHSGGLKQRIGSPGYWINAEGRLSRSIHAKSELATEMACGGICDRLGCMRQRSNEIEKTFPLIIASLKIEIIGMNEAFELPACSREPSNSRNFQFSDSRTGFHRQRHVRAR
jgi:hypothetical protein